MRSRAFRTEHIARLSRELERCSATVQDNKESYLPLNVLSKPACRWALELIVQAPTDVASTSRMKIEQNPSHRT